MTLVGDNPIDTTQGHWLLQPLTRSQIFQWNGRESSRLERSKGITLCTSIKDKDRFGKAKILVLGTS